MTTLTSGGASPTILLCDFHDDTLDVYTNYFRFKGFEVLQATNATDAFDSAVRHLPDAICTSYRLRPIDGADLSSRLKAHSTTQHIPVVIHTSYVHPTHLNRARGSGADTVLLDPLDPDVLYREVQGLIALGAKTL